MKICSPNVNIDKYLVQSYIGLEIVVQGKLCLQLSHKGLLWSWVCVQMSICMSAQQVVFFCVARAKGLAVCELLIKGKTDYFAKFVLY